MQLFYRHIGQGSPFIILHGLYGSSDNWVGFARGLQNEFEFIIPDLRNHGQSMHTAEFNYPVMCSDLSELMDSCKINKPILMGHSMGGKLAMEYARQYSDRLSSLIVLDIAPLSYTERPRESLLKHEQIIRAMLSVDLSQIDNRLEIEEELGERLGNRALCRFLLKNLSKDKNGQFKWRLNLQSLAANCSRLSEGITDMNYCCHVPALFVKAKNSTYINENDKAAIKLLYPESDFLEIEAASHCLHADQPLLLKAGICNFLKNNFNMNVHNI
ncbi:MAG: alpha/beta fold hydrolase [Prevotellaceae bacterium]|jgi:pimeloyl-ACP methyl ester carboxylesterase|nr:alpha/beta fold hydrolase [Prevotellaceae bacterium]